MDRKTGLLGASAELEAELDEMLKEDLRPEDWAGEFTHSEEEREAIRRWALAEGWDLGEAKQ